MTATKTPPDHFPGATKMIAALEDDVKAIRDALAPFAWCIESTDSSDWCWSATLDGVKSNAQFLDEGCTPGEPFAVVRKSDHDERLARLLAHIDAQALRLEAAERDAVRADVAMLRGSRKVLWNLLGECLPLLHQIERHDAESDERLGFLIGQIEAARSQVQAEELPGRI